MASSQSGNLRKRALRFEASFAEPGNSRLDDRLPEKTQKDGNLPERLSPSSRIGEACVI
jgi:hypothetical protein